MNELKMAYDLGDYEQFINNEIFAGRPLADFVAEVQRLYCEDKRPWVIGYSGGKDSSAVITLVYLALLGLEPELRSKPVFLVSSDTLVETPVVVDLISKTMQQIEKGAVRDHLPITAHPVVPKTNETFWVNLLGKGYPAPTRNFRWCTERMKINPVSDFIKSKVSQFDEVIVVLGSRSSESASRAQVIAKHKIDGSRLARHTTLANAFIYTPIDTWDVEDVWKLLRGAFKYAPDDIEEWESPWGGNNRPLWTLYMDSSGQGECPLVIDESTPSCGNSRFGCWTCTVVTKDRAMESLIQNGEDWMLPLLRFRDVLANTSAPEQKDIYRNYKRRTGKVQTQQKKLEKHIQDVDDVILYIKKQYIENLGFEPKFNPRYSDTNVCNYIEILDEDVVIESLIYKSEPSNKDSYCWYWQRNIHVPGPYWLKYRQQWLKELLEIEVQLNKEGHYIQLITEPELHEIRQQWLKDPNEPDWTDSLPKIYRKVYNRDLEWIIDDQSRFDASDAELLEQIASHYQVEPEMLMKLVELEISMEGLSRRQGIFDKIGSILHQDWGSLESITQKSHMQTRHQRDVHQDEIKMIEASIKGINLQLEQADDYAALFSEMPQS